MQSVSYYDIASESFYHGLVLGLCVTLDNRYLVTSNRESSEGRYLNIMFRLVVKKLKSVPSN